MTTRTFLLRHPVCKTSSSTGEQDYALLCTTKPQQHHITDVFPRYSSQTAGPFLLRKCTSALPSVTRKHRRAAYVHTKAAILNTGSWVAALSSSVLFSPVSPTPPPQPQTANPSFSLDVWSRLRD